MKTKLGTIVINAEGLRKLANSLDMIYGEGTVLNMPVWKDEQGTLLFFQLAEDSGEISCVVR